MAFREVATQGRRERALLDNPLFGDRKCKCEQHHAGRSASHLRTSPRMISAPNSQTMLSGIRTKIKLSLVEPLKISLTTGASKADVSATAACRGFEIKHSCANWQKLYLKSHSKLCKYYLERLQLMILTPTYLPNAADPTV
jgi:hypothetical protein